MRGERPFIFTCVRKGKGVEDVAAFVVREGLLETLIPFPRPAKRGEG